MSNNKIPVPRVSGIPLFQKEEKTCFIWTKSKSAERCVTHIVLFY